MSTKKSPFRRMSAKGTRALKDPAPWRLVAHIEERKAVRRATSGSWFLTLECGHCCSRKMPAKNFSNEAALICGNKKVMARYLAPRKVRCHSCWCQAFHDAERSKK